MKIYKIYVDGQAYQGEDPNTTYSTNIGGKGWHVSNHGSANVLLFGEGDPHACFGVRGLMSHMERIAKRIQDGIINPNVITIDVMEEIEVKIRPEVVGELYALRAENEQLKARIAEMQSPPVLPAER